MLLLLALVCSSPAATFTVAPDGTGDYTLLSEALWNASPGDVVLVAAGTCSPSRGEQLPLCFAAGVEVAGAGSDVAVVDAEGAGTVGITTSPNIVMRDLGFRGATGVVLHVTLNGDLYVGGLSIADNDATAIVADTGDTAAEDTAYPGRCACRGCEGGGGISAWMILPLAGLRRRRRAGPRY